MNAVAHSNTAAMMKAYPAGATGRIYQSIQYWPISNRIASVQHRFCFTIRTGNRSCVKMISSNYDRRFYFSGSYQFIKSKPGPFSFTLTNPTDTCGQSLESDFFL